MELRNLDGDCQSALTDMLAYLNLSSGTPDVRFQQHVNLLFARIEHAGGEADRSAGVLQTLLVQQLGIVRGTRAAFQQVDQAAAVLGLVFDELLPRYRRFHADLLYHQTPATLFRPLFIARCCEVALQQGPPWDETERIVAGALSQFNDFLGHRPVAVLRTAQRVEPYAHERVRPIPLYLRGAGVGVGRYHDLIEQALAILGTADGETLEQACFDLELLDELALDPRAYDFDHPVNKRPNYHFGQWDPHQIDNQGRYRRFVLEEVILDALWQRTMATGTIPFQEALFEAGAVLAGLILMASGTSGRGPETHDSATTLATLMPRIAAYREAFYEHLLASLVGPHGERLRAEAVALRQSFGGARQHFNQRLARLRAAQLQHVHLAQMFARMGYPEASARQAHIVPVASARMLCEINARLTAGHHAIHRGDPAAAAALLPEIEDILRRAIQCGALVDPWNILGFQGQFSLFPAPENSVRDHRVDVLIHQMDQIFGLYARLQGEAAARGDGQLVRRLAADVQKLARWWDRFATLDVSGVEHVSGRAAADSAAHVAETLGAWHEGGAAAGDIAFWRRHVERFDSPKAYALVVEALLEKSDFVAAMALLVQWLGQAPQVPLAEGEYSFFDLTARWFAAVRSGSSAGGAAPPERRWAMMKRFFDYLEANAEDYWEVPRFELGARGSAPSAAADQDESDHDDDDDEGLFSAAYDDVTYRDSTADGQDADMLEGAGPVSDSELEREAERLEPRLAFLAMLARLWKMVSLPAADDADSAARDEVLGGWFARAVANRRGLFELLKAVHRFALAAPTGTRDSLVEFDQRRQWKDMLLARVIAACVEMSAAARWLLAAADKLDGSGDLTGWELRSVGVLAALFRGDAQRVRALFPALRTALEQEPILYVPLARHGTPGPIVGAQTVQHLLLTLLGGLPRLGLLVETCQVLSSAQAMEQHRPAKDGAVTEFDRLFEVGYRGIVEALVTAAQEHATPSAELEAATDAELIDCLQTVTESLLKRWLNHSRSLRLSVLEKVAAQERFAALTDFIRRFGRELFTPRFLNLGNLRAILHQGVDAWLRTLEDDPELAADLPPAAELGRGIPRAAAVEQLSLVIEAVVENYTEFKDFNSTTTQSDRGECLYMLFDFLRLKTGYERFMWNLRPVLLAHEVLVRRGRTAAAELWRRAVAERTSQAADWHLQRFDELSRQYGMRLPTVADRLAERFVRPLAIDRVKSLIRPAVEEGRRGAPSTSFDLLEQELAEFTDQPCGAGLDVPAWLVALEREVDLALDEEHQRVDLHDIVPCVPRLPLTWDEVQSQFKPGEF